MQDVEIKHYPSISNMKPAAIFKACISLWHHVHPPLNLSLFFHLCAFLRSDSMSCSRPQANNQISLQFPLSISCTGLCKRKTWSVRQLPGRVLSPWFTAIWFNVCPPLRPDILNQHFFGTTWLLKCRQQLHLYDDVA